MNNKITALTVNISSCDVISENLLIFLPLLKNVSRLTINSNSGSQESLSGLLNVIYILRLFKLHTFQFKNSFQRLSLENCKIIWRAVYGPLEPNRFVVELLLDNLSRQEILKVIKLPKRVENDDILEKDLLGSSTDYLYEDIEVTAPRFLTDEASQSDTDNGPPLKRQCLGNSTDEDDLFNFALEPFEETVHVDTKIETLDISLAHIDIYNPSFVPALFKWSRLKSLSLSKVLLFESEFSVICHTLKDNLRELKLSEFDCCTHFKALGLLSLSKLYISQCELPENFFRTLLHDFDDNKKDDGKISVKVPRKQSATELKVLEISGEDVLSADLCQGLKENRSLISFKSFCTYDYNEIALSHLLSVISRK